MSEEADGEPQTRQQPQDVDTGDGPLSEAYQQSREEAFENDRFPDLFTEEEPVEETEEPDGDEPAGEDTGEPAGEQEPADSDDEPTAGEPEVGDGDDQTSDETDPSTDIEALQDENEQLRETVREQRQQINYYLQTEEGRNQIINWMAEQGHISAEALPEGELDPEVEETLQLAQQFMPEDQYEQLESTLKKKFGVEQGGGQDPTAAAQDPLTSTVLRMEESDKYPHFEQLGREPDPHGGANEQWTFMDKVAEENPQKYLTQNGQYKPEMLPELYREAEAKAREEGILGEDAGTGDGDGDGEVDVDQLRQEIRQEVIEELQEADEAAPESPASGGGEGESVMPENPSLRDAFDQAQEETAA